MLTQALFLQALQIGTFAYVVSSELIKPKHILHFWFVWLEKLEKKYPKIAYPIGYCEKCFAGQIALWYFLFTQQFNFIHLVLFISFAILTPIILKKWFYTAPEQIKERGITITTKKEPKDIYVQVGKYYLVSLANNSDPFDKEKPFKAKVVSIKQGYIKYQRNVPFNPNQTMLQTMRLETFKKIIIHEK